MLLNVAVSYKWEYYESMFITEIKLRCGKQTWCVTFALRTTLLSIKVVSICILTIPNIYLYIYIYIYIYIYVSLRCKYWGTRPPSVVFMGKLTYIERRNKKRETDSLSLLLLPVSIHGEPWKKKLKTGSETDSSSLFITWLPTNLLLSQRNSGETLELNGGWRAWNRRSSGSNSSCCYSKAPGRLTGGVGLAVLLCSVMCFR